MMIIDTHQELDLHLGDYFRDIGSVPPDVRHSSIQDLLGKYPFESADRSPGGEEGGTERTQVGFSLIRQRIKDHLAPTYLVANYWNPLDGRRRSIFWRANWAESTNYREMLINAYLFYLLTFAGEGRRCDQVYTLTHYLARVAQHKAIVVTTFRHTLVDAGTRVIIPAGGDLSRLDDKLGLGEIVAAATEESTKISLALLEGNLGELLSRRQAVHWSLLDKNGIATRALETIDESFSSLDRRANSALIALHSRLARDLAGAGGERLSLKQVAVIVASQQLWRKVVDASATRYMYALPVQLGRETCVLTLGTRRLLSRSRLLFAQQLARSLFSHPLIEDHQSRAVDQEVLHRNNVFRRFLSHSFPKILIVPAKQELRRLKKTWLAEEGAGASLLSYVARLECLFSHYELLLQSFEPASSEEGVFRIRPQAIDWAADVEPTLTAAFEMLRQNRLSPELQSRMSLDLDVDRKVAFRFDPAVLVEILFNLLGNAVQQLTPSDVIENSQRGRVNVFFKAIPQRPGWIVTGVEDMAGGFNESKLDDFRRLQLRLSRIPRLRFLGEIDRALGWELQKTAKEERLGIGLTYCLAQVIALRWHPAFKRSGSIDITTARGVGSRIAVTVPSATQDHGTLVEPREREVGT